ncbi:MAG: PAS domain S-box protein, partial [Candidatus Omnitrophota bacterium]
MSFVKCSSQSVLFNSLQGSSISHFVIDKGHKIVEWNRACEVLTGYSASRMIGTANHWMAFYSSQRLFLPDLILDKVSQSKLIKSCNSMKYKKSSLLEGAYEIEGFFTPLGKAGRWLRFTAALLKGAKGKITAVIVTLEDISISKNVEKDKERLNKELIKTNRKLKTMVLKDYDTGLFNHRFLGEVLSVELTRSKRTGQPLSLL